jgi:hypothetical protein
VFLKQKEQKAGEKERLYFNENGGMRVGAGVKRKGYILNVQKFKNEARKLKLLASMQY